MRTLPIIIVFVACGAFAAAPTAAQSAHANETVVRTLFDKTWNDASFDELGRLLTPDFRFHFRGRANAMTTAQFQQMVVSWRQIFPDLRFRVEDVVSSGDRVAARLTFTGTHRGAAWGIEPAGRTVTVTMMGFFRIADGRIAEMWEDYDEHGMRQQMLGPHALVGMWKITYPGHVDVENGVIKATMETGELRVEAVGDSLIATLIRNPTSQLPQRQPVRLAARLASAEAVFVMRNQVTLTTGEGERHATAVSTWTMGAQGNQLGGSLERRLEGDEASSSGPQPLAGTRIRSQ